MRDIIDKSLVAYFKQWGTIASIISVNKPTAVGWKVADEHEYQQKYNKLRPLCDKIVETWMNGRWIAKMHLKDSKLQGNIEIVKLMQRRPGSNDTLGLDHIDFICRDIKQVEAQLKNSDLKWSWESNDVVADYDWISIWFNGTEAKLKQGTVIDIVIQELQELNQHIKE